MSQAPTLDSVPIRVLCGDDLARRDAYLETLLERYAAAGADIERYTLDETPLADVLASARTVPMFSEWRLIVAKRADGLGSDDYKLLSVYLEAPNAATSLVLVATQMDGRLRFVQQLKKQQFFKVFAAPKASRVNQWLREEASRRGLRIDNDGLAALVDTVGATTLALQQALDRLRLAQPQDLRAQSRGTPIGADAIRTMFARTREGSIWPLVDAFGAGKEKRFFEELSLLLRHHEPPLRIAAMLLRQLRMLALMRAALSRGVPPQAAAVEAGAPPFKASDLAMQSRRFSGRSLRFALARLAKLDRELKGSNASPALALELAALEVLRS